MWWSGDAAAAREEGGEDGELDVVGALETEVMDANSEKWRLYMYICLHRYAYMYMYL